MIIVAFNLVPNAIILKGIINFSGWAFVQFTIATYSIAGMSVQNFNWNLLRHSYANLLC
jgi:hypothetical protein